MNPGVIRSDQDLLTCGSSSALRSPLSEASFFFNTKLDIKGLQSEASQLKVKVFPECFVDLGAFLESSRQPHVLVRPGNVAVLHLCPLRRSLIPGKAGRSCSATPTTRMRFFCIPSQAACLHLHGRLCVLAI